MEFSARKCQKSKNGMANKSLSGLCKIHIQYIGSIGTEFATQNKFGS